MKARTRKGMATNISDRCGMPLTIADIMTGPGLPTGTTEGTTQDITYTGAIMHRGLTTATTGAIMRHARV